MSLTLASAVALIAGCRCVVRFCVVRNRLIYRVTRTHP